LYVRLTRKFQNEIFKMPKMDSRLLCIFLSVFNVAWVFLTAPGLSFDQFLLLACSLSTLYCLKHSAATEDACESMESLVLRKQIQEINWRIMFNKATYLAQMQNALERSRPELVRHRSTSPRDDTCPKSNMAKARRWKSWSPEPPAIPDFHAHDCRNSEIQKV